MGPLLAGGLVVVGLWLRASALAPSSLWLDDAWISLVHRADSVGQVIDMSLTAPGFGLTLAGLFAATGFSELTAQLPALIAGLIGPVAVLVVARRCGLAWAAALLAAVLLLVAPEHVLHSTRVKAFTADTLFGVVALGCGWWLVARDACDRRVWFTLAGVGITGTVYSAAAALVVAPVVATVWLVLVTRIAMGRELPGERRPGPAGTLDLDVRSRQGQALVARPRAVPRNRSAVGEVARAPRRGPGAVIERTRQGDLRTAAIVTAGLALALIAWYVGVIRPAVTEGLHAYWEAFYLDTTSLRTLVDSLGSAAYGVVRGVAPAGAPWAAGIVVVAAVASFWRRPAASLVLVSPLVLAVALAGLQLVPLGGGRTDLHLYGSLVLLVGSGVDALLRHPALHVTAVLVAVGCVGVAAGQRPDYPQQDVAAFVAEVDVRRAAGETVVVYPATRWAYALYTDGPVAFRFGERTANGYEPVFDAASVVVLEPQREPPYEHRRQLEAALEGRSEVVLIASHWRPDLAVAEEAMAAIGFDPVERTEAPGALLVRFRR